jgi:hypothetical protein
LVKINVVVVVLSTMSSIHNMFSIPHNLNNKGKRKHYKEQKSKEMNNLGP